MGKKDKKKKTGAGAAKTADKTAKKDLKKLKKETGEDDIDAILSEITKKEATEKKFWDGAKTYCYNDLFVYNIKKHEWKKVASPNTPPPRSAHQCIVVDRASTAAGAESGDGKTAAAATTGGGAGGELWLFGGEFVSPSQSQFHHFNDLWCLNLADWSWTAVKAKAGPSARSGHRMVYYQRKIIVFGGFYDNGRDTRFFNDLHVFDLDTHTWTEKKSNSASASAVPSPRSGFQFVVIDDCAYLFGGYSNEKKAAKKPAAAVAAAPAGGKKAVASAGGGDDVRRSHVHSDIWCLNLTTFAWSSVKKAGVIPAPRSGMTSAVIKKNVYFFGGVVDEETDVDFKSTYQNDLFLWNGEQTKYFEFKLSAAPVPAPTATATAAPAATDAKSAPSTTGAAAASNGPTPRSGSMCAVKGNILYVFGGQREDRSKEFTFNDFYTLDVTKSETSDKRVWTTLVPLDPTMAMKWAGDADEEEGDDDDDEDADEKGAADKKKSKSAANEDDDDEEDEEDDGDGDEDEDDNDDDETDSKKKPAKPAAATVAAEKRDDTPVKGELVAVYFNRSKQFWLDLAKTHLPPAPQPLPPPPAAAAAVSAPAAAGKTTKPVASAGAAAAPLTATALKKLKKAEKEKKKAGKKGSAAADDDEDGDGDGDDASGKEREKPKTAEQTAAETAQRAAFDERERAIAAHDKELRRIAFDFCGKRYNEWKAAPTVPSLVLPTFVRPPTAAPPPAAAAAAAV